MSASKFPSRRATYIVAPPGSQFNEIGPKLCSRCFMLPNMPDRPRLTVVYIGGLIRGKIHTIKDFREQYEMDFEYKQLLPDSEVISILCNSTAKASVTDHFVIVGFPCTKAQFDFAVREGFIDENTRFIHLTSPQEERLARLMELTKRETNPMSETDVITLVRKQETALMDVVANAERLCKTDTLRVAEPPPKFVPMLIKWLTAEAY